MQLARAGLVIVGMLGLVGRASADSKIRGAQGRFTVTVPEGWKPAANDAGLTVTKGTAYAAMLVVDGAADAESLVAERSQSIGGQWKDVQELKRGACRFGGGDGVFVVLGGTNPAGVPAFMRIVGAVAGGKGYVLMASAPQAEFGAAKPVFDSLERTFAPGGAKAAPDSKLAALDAALKAGILSREEYEAKKRALGTEPAGAGTTAMATAPPPEAAGAGATYQSPDHSFTTKVPKGWRARSAPGQPGLSYLEPESGGDERIIMSAGAATAGSIQELAQQAVQLAGQMFGLQPQGAPTFAKRGAVPTAELRYQGANVGGEVRAWNAMMLKDRNYFAVLSLARPEKAQAVEQQARFVFANLGAGTVQENSALARAIVGRWTYYQGGSSGAGSSRSSSSVSRTVVFYANGRFAYTGGVYVSADTPSGGTNSASGDNSASGTFRIVGNTLTARFDNGQSGVFTLEPAGSTGLKINGDLYIRE